MSEVKQAAVAAMPVDTSAWERVEAGTRAFLRSYVGDDHARNLLGQAISVLGWDRVRKLDEEMSLPLIRAILDEAIDTGAAVPIPVVAAAEILFSLYCNGVLAVAANEHPIQAAADVETVIFTLLGGMRTAAD